MPTKKTYSGSQRVRKAYWVATVVMLSYGWLLLRGKIFGKQYYETHSRPAPAQRRTHQKSHSPAQRPVY
ncbi:MAG: hypothetical protein IPM36_01265 [Lewinellaceae bacterium]|nr:hypothetical protein [Lewinellaceae bacterium]